MIFIYFFLMKQVLTCNPSRWGIPVTSAQMGYELEADNCRTRSCILEIFIFIFCALLSSSQLGLGAYTRFVLLLLCQYFPKGKKKKFYSNLTA